MRFTYRLNNKININYKIISLFFEFVSVRGDFSQLVANGDFTITITQQLWCWA